MEFMSASRQLEANFLKINLRHAVSVLVLDTRTGIPFCLQKAVCMSDFCNLPVSVSPSVCPSHAGIISKRSTGRGGKLYHQAINALW